MAAFQPAKTSLILTLILGIGLSHLAYSITLFDATIVLSNTSNRTQLTAGCKSNGDDVGTLTIPPLGRSYFLSHVLVKERSVATCSMRLGNLHGSFDVFDWGRDKKRCADKVCFWQIDERGLSLLVDTGLVLQFHWG